MSHRLRTAMLRAQLDPAALAAAAGVDVKTVNRWLAGRIPHQRTRLTVADLLGETEADLWPQTRPDLAVSDESTDVRFVDPTDFDRIPIHDTVRLRLHHHAEHRDTPYLG